MYPLSVMPEASSMAARVPVWVSRAHLHPMPRLPRTPAKLPEQSNSFGVNSYRSIPQFV